MEWISVKDRLPELNEPLIGYNDENEKVILIENYKATVLAFDEKIGIFKAQYNSRGWSEIASHFQNGIVKPLYWMPLPEPPKK